MASNFEIVEKYTDLKPAKQLDRATLNKMVWRSLNLQGSFNYERMQANGWLYSILPGLTKIHTKKEDLATSMKHNLEFFNTHPYLVPFVMGIVLALEQQKAEVATIRAVRVAAMGPLGGIGDAIFWFTLMPIIAGITANWAIAGNMMGPVLYFVIVFGVQMALRFFLMYWSYDLGIGAIESLTKNAKEFTRAASMLGVLVVGALTAFYGGTTTALKFANGVDKDGNTVYIVVQDILNGIIPHLLPLAITLVLFFLIRKKNMSPVACITGLLVLGLVGAAVGFF